MVLKLRLLLKTSIANQLIILARKAKENGLEKGSWPSRETRASLFLSNLCLPNTTSEFTAHISFELKIKHDLVEASKKMKTRCFSIYRMAPSTMKSTSPSSNSKTWNFK